MSSANKFNSTLRAIALLTFIMISLLISGCMNEPEVCDYNAICLENETDNCADCKEVLGRDARDPTGNVILYDGNNV